MVDFVHMLESFEKLFLPLEAYLQVYFHERYLIKKQLRAMGIDEAKTNVDVSTGHVWGPEGNGLLHVKSQNDTLVFELRPNAEVYVPLFNCSVKISMFIFY